MTREHRIASSQQPPEPGSENLELLAGAWRLEITSMSFAQDPKEVVLGQASFEWLEGKAFLIERSEVPGTDFPRATAVLGWDNAAETYGMLYSDSRGVSRIYQMSFTNGVWKIWRDFQGFSQRYIGTFSDDHNRIVARWEKSTDGSNWEHDFDLTYTRIQNLGKRRKSRKASSEA